MGLSGIWGHNDLPFLDLTVAGGRSTRAAIKRGSFDPGTNALRLEGDAPSLDGEGNSHYVIEGSLDKEALSGTYDCGGLKGDFTFTRLAEPLT